MYPFFRNSISFLLDFTYPRYCVVCGKNLIFSLPETGIICADCENDIPEIQEYLRCRKCGGPLVSEIEICSRCRERTYAFERNYPVFEYTGYVKALIRKYKFENQKCAALWFGRHIARNHSLYCNGIPIVPVPPRRKQKRERGWDHIEVIAEILKKEYGIPYLTLLKRIGQTPQKSLDYDGRIENLKGAYSIKPVKNHLPKEVVLLDDVFTTGATLNGCAGILKMAGVITVYGITIAID